MLFFELGSLENDLGLGFRDLVLVGLFGSEMGVRILDWVVLGCDERILRSGIAVEIDGSEALKNRGRFSEPGKVILVMWVVLGLRVFGVFLVC